MDPEETTQGVQDTPEPSPPAAGDERAPTVEETALTKPVEETPAETPQKTPPAEPSDPPEAPPAEPEAEQEAAPAEAAAEATVKPEVKAEAAPEAPPAEPPATDGGEADPLQPGAIVRGKVSKITDNQLEVTLADDVVGTLDRSELKETDGMDDLTVGETLEVYVLGGGGPSEPLRLSRTLARGGRSPDDLERCFKEGIAVEGKIGSRCKGGYDVHIAGQRAFLPMSQASLDPIKDEDSLVGWIGRFHILEFHRRRRNVVVSRRKVLRAESRARAKDLAQSLEVGQVCEGVVKQIREYGAFVDIGGVEGLVHISEFSWNRVEKPEEMLAKGDRVKVKVIRYSKGAGKVSLSIRQLETNPWDALGESFKEGDVYEGKVTRIEEYGALVELTEGLEGLVHNSELSWDMNVRDARGIVEPGQTVKVKLLGFEKKRRRCSLSIKALEDNPWASVAKEFPVGTQAQGTVEQVAKFGIFVNIGPGVTALIPISRTGVPREVNLHRRFKIGSSVKAEVIEIDIRRRRMTLSIADPEGGVDRDASAYFKQQKKEKVSLGTFGDLLSGLDIDDD